MMTESQLGHNNYLSLTMTGTTATGRAVDCVIMSLISLGHLRQSYAVGLRTDE